MQETLITITTAETIKWGSLLFIFLGWIIWTSSIGNGGGRFDSLDKIFPFVPFLVAIIMWLIVY